MGFRVSNLDEFRIQESWVLGGPRETPENPAEPLSSQGHLTLFEVQGFLRHFLGLPTKRSVIGIELISWTWKKWGGFNIFTPLFCLETSSQTYWSNKVCTCNIWQAQTAIFPTQSFWCIIEEFKRTTIIICLNIDLWQCEAEPHLSVFYASNISRSGASLL